MKNVMFLRLEAEACSVSFLVDVMAEQENQSPRDYNKKTKYNFYNYSEKKNDYLFRPPLNIHRIMSMLANEESRTRSIMNKR